MARIPEAGEMILFGPWEIRRIAAHYVSGRVDQRLSLRRKKRLATSEASSSSTGGALGSKITAFQFLWSFPSSLGVIFAASLPKYQGPPLPLL
jgi:hypothetical protein